MADNLGYTPGSGAKVATDDLVTLNGEAVSEAQHAQRMKVGFGADGDFNDVNGNNPLPVFDALQSPIASYLLNDFADGDPLYLGKVKADGTWLVQRYGAASGEMRYANLSNNAGLTYATAWSGKASLNYALFQALTGV